MIWYDLITMANLSPQVLKKAGEMGIIKGRALGTIKQQIIKTSDSRERGLSKFKNVQRTIINPTTSKTAGQLRSAFDILQEAKVLKSAYKGQPLTLLQRAKANIVTAEKKVVEEKKAEMREYSKKARLEDEGVTRKGVHGGLLEKIEEEHTAKDNAAKVLEEVKRTDSADHQVSVFETSKPKDKPIVEMSID